MEWDEWSGSKRRAGRKEGMNRKRRPEKPVGRIEARLP